MVRFKYRSEKTYRIDSSTGTCSARIEKKPAFFQAIRRLPDWKNVFLICDSKGIRFQSQSPSTGSLTELSLDHRDFTTFDYNSESSRLIFNVSVDAIKYLLDNASTDSFQINTATGEVNFVEFVLESEHGILKELRMHAEDIDEHCTCTKPIHNLDEVKYEVSITENYAKMERMFENIQCISRKVNPRPFVDPTATTTSSFGSSSSLGKSAYNRHQTYIGELIFKCQGNREGGTFCVLLESNTKEDRERELMREEQNPQKDRKAHIKIRCENFEGKTDNISAKVCVGKLGRTVFKTKEFHNGGNRLDGSMESENQKKKKTQPFAKKNTIILQLAAHSAKATIILDDFKYPTSCFTLYMEAEKNDENDREQDDAHQANAGLLSRRNNEVAASRKGCNIC